MGAAPEAAADRAVRAAAAVARAEAVEVAAVAEDVLVGTDRVALETAVADPAVAGAQEAAPADRDSEDRGADPACQVRGGRGGLLARRPSSKHYRDVRGRTKAPFVPDSPSDVAPVLPPVAVAALVTDRIDTVLT